MTDCWIGMFMSLGGDLLMVDVEEAICLKFRVEDKRCICDE
jgi:hypothetical protein